MNPYSTFISLLFASRTQAHVFHLQTNSYAMHKALNGYYDDIIISISENEQIGSIISIMISEGKSKEEIEKELVKRGISKEVINEWLQYM